MHTRTTWHPQRFMSRPLVQHHCSLTPRPLTQWGSESQEWETEPLVVKGVARGHSVHGSRGLCKSRPFHEGLVEPSCVMETRGSSSVVLWDRQHRSLGQLPCGVAS